MDEKQKKRKILNKGKPLKHTGNKQRLLEININKEPKIKNPLC